MDFFPDILLIILLSFQLIIYVFSSVQLFRYSDVYPIKQLSPLVTFIVSSSLFASCLLLSSIRLFDIQTTDPEDSTVEILREIYQFLRELGILGFYFRCFRICLAYNAFGARRWLMWVFTRELAMIAVAGVFSAVLVGVHFIEKATDIEPSIFFRFFELGGNKTAGTYILYAVDNLLFFLILWFSIKVSKKFKFIKSLTCIFILYHLQQWYQITQRQICSKNFSHNSFYCPVITNLLCMVILVIPCWKPKEYELPLPNEVILSNHNMFLQYDEAYIIFFKFAKFLEEHSVREEEKRREACKYLEIYTVYTELKKKMIYQQNMEGSDIEFENKQLVYYIQKHIIPNYQYLQILQQTTQRLFLRQPITIENLRPGLRIADLEQFNRRITKAIKYLYNEWLKTESKEELRRELQANNQVINRMYKLNISI